MCWMPGFQASSLANTQSLPGKPLRLLNHEMGIPPLCPALSCLPYALRGGEGSKSSGNAHEMKKVQLEHGMTSADGRTQILHPWMLHSARHPTQVQPDTKSIPGVGFRPESPQPSCSVSRLGTGEEAAASSALSSSEELPTSPAMAPELGSLS